MPNLTPIPLDTINAARIADAPPLLALRNAMVCILERSTAAWQARQTRAVLATLDDHILDDIGLARSTAPRPALPAALRDQYR